MRKVYIAPAMTTMVIAVSSMICSSTYDFDPSSIDMNGVNITDADADEAASRGGSYWDE